MMKSAACSICALPAGSPSPSRHSVSIPRRRISRRLPRRLWQRNHGRQALRTSMMSPVWSASCVQRTRWECLRSDKPHNLPMGEYQAGTAPLHRPRLCIAVVCGINPRGCGRPGWRRQSSHGRRGGANASSARGCRLWSAWSCQAGRAAPRLYMRAAWPRPRGRWPHRF